MPHRRHGLRARALVLIGPLALLASGCGPAPAKPVGKPPAKAVVKPRKCPDPEIRDTKDPCSIAYLEPYKPRVQRDKF